MNDAPLRFLQQENTRLQEENRGLRQENTSLRGYLQAVGELYAAMQRLESVETPLHVLDELLQKTMTVIGASDGSISRLDRFVPDVLWRDASALPIRHTVDSGVFSLSLPGQSPSRCYQSAAGFSDGWRQGSSVRPDYTPRSNSRDAARGLCDCFFRGGDRCILPGQRRISPFDCLSNAGRFRTC